MVQPFPRLRVQAVADGFGRVDGTAAADADDGVDRGVVLDNLGGFVELRDGGVFANLAEGAGVLGAQELLDVFDEGRFGGERVAGDDECFAGLAGKAVEEVFLY